MATGRRVSRPRYLYRRAHPRLAAVLSYTLILNDSGGTIGMLVGHQGYVPEPHYLTETLRSQTRFHDPMQDSLFSNSGSVQGFRNWSSGSGRPNPQTDTRPSSPPNVAQRTLVVRSSRPIGQRSSSVSMARPTCVQVSENVYEAQLPSLVTPCSAVPGGTHRKSIRYAILEVSICVDFLLAIDDWSSGILSWIAAI